MGKKSRAELLGKKSGAAKKIMRLPSPGFYHLLDVSIGEEPRRAQQRENSSEISISPNKVNHSMNIFCFFCQSENKL